MAAERGFEPPVPLANEKVIRDRAEGVIDDSDPNGPTEYRSYAGGATNSAKSTSPTTELRERPMHDGTNLPVPERTGIPGDCATLFVSLELSRSTWVATSLAPGSKKMSKHTLAGGNGRELLDLLARLKARAEQRIAAQVKERCGEFGDEVDQAAWCGGNTMTSMPFWNLMPCTTFGNWFSPFNRRHVFAAALTSLNTMSLAVLADKAPLVRMVR